MGVVLGGGWERGRGGSGWRCWCCGREGGRAEEADFLGLVWQTQNGETELYSEKLLKVNERFILSILPPRVGTLPPLRLLLSPPPPFAWWCFALPLSPLSFWVHSPLEQTE